MLINFFKNMVKLQRLKILSEVKAGTKGMITSRELKGMLKENLLNQNGEGKIFNAKNVKGSYTN